MKEIFQEYGTAIIAIITGIALIGLIFGVQYAGKTGIFEIAGTTLQKEEIDYTAYRDFDAVKLWYEREKPQVFYVTSKGRFFADENAEFLKRYYAKDMEGVVYYLDEVIIRQRYPNIMFAAICDIRNSHGNSVINYYNQSNGYIYFQEPGIYEVYFRVIDRENVEETWRIPIVVDEGR